CTIIPPLSVWLDIESFCRGGSLSSLPSRSGVEQGWLKTRPGFVLLPRLPSLPLREQLRHLWRWAFPLAPYRRRTTRCGILVLQCRLLSLQSLVVIGRGGALLSDGE